MPTAAVCTMLKWIGSMPIASASREHHGDQHNRGRQALEQHAEQAAQDSGADQEQPGMRLERPEHFPEQLRHAAHAHQVLIDRGDGQQEHDRPP